MASRYPRSHKSTALEPGLGNWTLKPYRRPDGSYPYQTFVKKLDPYEQRVLDAAVQVVLVRQGHNVCGTEWGTALGRGLYEFRVRQSLSAICQEPGMVIPDGFNGDSEVLLRVFFAVEGNRIVLLLGGYDKGKDPSGRRQNREIEGARRLLKEHKTESRKKR